MSKAKKNRNRKVVASIVEAEPENLNNKRARKGAGLLKYFRQHLWASALITFLSIGALGAVLKYLDEDAQRQKLLAAKDRSALSSINPFMPAPPPSPTPQLSRENLYVGQRLLSSIDSSAQEIPPSDLAIWRPASSGSVWWVLSGAANGNYSGYSTYTFGSPGDQPVPGDYDGDGKTDFAIYRPLTFTFWVNKSSDGSTYSVTLGSSGDIPAPADYDGDGKTDIAVWRPSTGVWYIFSSSIQSYSYPTFGTSGDKPAPADFDGDGKADLAVWRNSNTTFYSSNSSNGNLAYYTLGVSSTEPVSADYDGDGKADYAIRQSSSSNWIIRNSSSNTTDTISWQNSTDTEVHNDYDGDGKCDIAVWRPTDSPSGTLGYWYIRPSTNTGTTRSVQWGTTGDYPQPAFYKH
jgi:hypothetical protein